jgi:hypothetical protein
MPFWQMESASDGRSTIAQRMLEGFLQKSVSGDTTAIWMREFPGTVKAVWFNILPVGWIGELHPSPFGGCELGALIHELALRTILCRDDHRVSFKHSRRESRRETGRTYGTRLQISRSWKRRHLFNNDHVP